MAPATIENLDHEWSPQPISQTRRLTVILPQCYAVLAILAVNLSHVTFESTVFLATQFLDIGSTSFMTYGLMTWIGLLAGGIVAHITGARVILMLAGVVSVASWIALLGWISSAEVLKWIFYIAALAKGMIQGPSYVYVAEISQPNTRTALMAAICLTVKDGLVDNYSTVYLNLTSEGPTKIAVFANVVLAFFGLVVIFYLPESPYWLASKGRYRAVESSLAWFRGSTTVENVNAESKSIISNAKDSPTACKFFCQKSPYIAALIVVYVFLVTAFVRMLYIAYLLHPEALLSISAKFGDTSEDTSLAWGISTVVITIAFVLLVAIVGKKIMILISWFCGSTAVLIAYDAKYLNESNVLSTDAYSWYLLICEAVAYFSLITGVISVPLMLNGEIFPSKLRNVGAGLGFIFVYLVNVVSNNLYAKYFPISDDARWPLALASIMGFISLLWLFPRNENKSLVEIEHGLTSINELRRKK